MNYIKRVIFRFWFEWHRITRMKFGSNRIPFILFKIFGRASYTVEGVKMHLSPYEFFWRQMMEGKIESGTVLSAINKYLPQNGTLLDVGANIGFFTCWASVNKNANVFAIEPSLRELMVLRMNIKHNNSSNIEVFPFAVGQLESEVELTLAPDHHPGMNSILTRGENLENSKTETISVKRIDALFDENELRKINVCKIDVEGYEIDVIKGFGTKLGLMSNCVFIVEVSPHFLSRNGFSVKELYDVFAAFGFKGILGASETKQYDEIFKYSL